MRTLAIVGLAFSLAFAGAALAEGLKPTSVEDTKKFLADAAVEKGAVKTPSGLIYIEMTPGTGPKPKASSRVKVHYSGTLIDGKEFDSSYSNGQPASFRLNEVIPCWTEGLQRMKVGGKSKLICPADIAYGSRGAGGVIPPNAALVFEVELLRVD